MANLNNHPIEVIENDIGMIVREYDVRPDSGGPGKWRGGTGQTLSFEVLKDGGVVMSRGMERTVFTAWGFDGGMPARAFRVIVNRGRPDERELRKIDQLAAKAASLQERLADPDLFAKDSKKFAELSQQLAKLEAEKAHAEEEWLALEMLREEIEG